MENNRIYESKYSRLTKLNYWIARRIFKARFTKENDFEAVKGDDICDKDNGTLKSRNVGMPENGWVNNALHGEDHDAVKKHRTNFMTLYTKFAKKWRASK